MINQIGSKWRIAISAILALLGATSQSQTLDYKTSWIGNSFGYYHNNVQHDIEALYVAPDGTCFVNGIGNEGSMDCAIYKSGTFVNFVSNLGSNGGYAVTANSTYLFEAVQMASGTMTTTSTNAAGNPFNPINGNIWYGVKRCTLSGSVPATNMGVNGYAQKGDFLLVYNDPPNAGYPANQNGTLGLKGGSIRGLASTDTQLFVSDTAENLLKVYTTSGSLQYSVSVPRPAGLAYDTGRNLLWMISTSDGVNPPAILCYDPATGAQQTGKCFSLPTVGNIPTGLALDNSGRLLITDAGQMQQNVLVYNNLDTTPAATTPFGVPGGVLSGTGSGIGLIGNQRFNGPTGVGCDSSGNIYVSSNGRPGITGGMYTGSLVECYTPAGALKSPRLAGLISYDMSSFDPSPSFDGTDIYSGQEHFKLTLSSTIPGGEWSYYGCTLDPYYYPQDIRQHVAGSYAIQTQRVNNHLFQVVNLVGMYGIAIYRFDNATDGEIAIPSVVFGARYMGFESATYPPGEPTSDTINKGTGTEKTLDTRGLQWIWTDSNGDGMFQGGTSQYTTASDGATYQTNGEYQLPGQSISLGSPLRIQMQSNGDIWWSAGVIGVINHWICGGLDTYGNPIYSWKLKGSVPPGAACYERIKVPAPFTSVHDVEYDPATDVMFLSGYTIATDYPDKGDGDQYLGRVVARYDHWSNYVANQSVTPAVTWRIVDDGSTNSSTTNSLPDVRVTTPVAHYMPIAMTVTGGYVFVQYQGLSNDLNSDNIRIYRKSDGVYVGKIYPDPAIVGDYTNIWVDMPQGIAAHVRSTGEYLILGEEDIFAKNFLYRWSAPPASPEGLLATAASDTQVNLYWPDVAGETSYRVECSTSGTGGPYTQTGTTGAGVNYYTATGLSASSNYCFRVIANNSKGDSGYSNPAQVTTLSSAAATGKNRLLFMDFQDDTDPFTGPVNMGGTTKILHNFTATGNMGVEFREVPATPGASTTFSFTLPSNHPLVRRINQVLSGTSPATFAYSYQAQRTAVSSQPASTNGRAGIECTLNDGNPPAGGLGRDRFWTGLPSFGSSLGSPSSLTSAYLAGSLITVDQSSYPQGFDGNAWRGYKFTVKPDGTGRQITGLNLTFEVRVTSGTLPEAYMVDNIIVDEILP